MLTPRFTARFLVLGLGLALGGCQSAKVAAPSQAALGAELVRLKGEGPPPSPDGECWAASVTPAVIETVTEQVMVSEEVRDVFSSEKLCRSRFTYELQGAEQQK